MKFKEIENKIKEVLLHLDINVLLGIIDDLCDYNNSIRFLNYKKNSEKFLRDCFGPDYISAIKMWVDNGDYSPIADTNNEYARLGVYGSLSSCSKSDVITEISDNFDTLFDSLLEYQYTILLPYELKSLFEDYNKHTKEVVSLVKCNNGCIKGNSYLVEEVEYICDRYSWQECDRDDDGISCPLFLCYGHCLVKEK